MRGARGPHRLRGSPGTSIGRRNLMNWFTRVGLVSALLLATGWAQSVTGTLTGTVADSSGAVVPGAKVAVRNEASGDIRRSVTNGEGFFDFSALPAATYSLE